MKKATIHLSCFIALLLISVGPVILYMSLSSRWYQFNYQYQRITKKKSPDFVNTQTNNLINFFHYRETLNSQWKSHEVRHMRDVRHLLTWLAILVFISLLFILALPVLARGAAANFLRTSSLLLLLLIVIVVPSVMGSFSFFWNQVFHPLFFKDGTWLYYKGDVSYFLFPLYFFVRSTFLLGACCVTTLLLIFLGSQIWITCRKSTPK